MPELQGLPLRKAKLLVENAGLRIDAVLFAESYEERNRCFEEFQRDPERAKAFKQSEEAAGGPLVEHTHNQMMRPTPFSPLR